MKVPASLGRVLVALGICGVTLSVFLSGCATQPDESDSIAGVVSFDPDGHPVFPRNAKGQTYGSSSDVAFEDEPDLVSVTATNGKFGYVLRGDLYEPDPANPEEAVARQNNKHKKAFNACVEKVGIPVTVEDDLAMGDISQAILELRRASVVGNSAELEQIFRGLLRIAGYEWAEADGSAAQAAKVCVEAIATVTVRVVPVYESDGETVIGEFKIG